MVSMSITLSVSELAVAVAPVVSHPREPSEGDVDVVLRRLRSWTVANAIKPQGSAHTGSGKHRRYEADTAYVAAALNVLAENDQGIGVLVTVGRFLRNLSSDKLIAGPAPDRWIDAIRGSRDVFMVLGAGDFREGFEERDKVQGLLFQEEFTRGVGGLPGGVFVNLTATFKLVRL
jgi:hypothetical protein